MKKITTRNTKSDIIAAYNALAKELKALKASAATPPRAVATSPAASEPAASPGAEMTIADIITSLRGLTHHIGDSASALQTDLSAEATALEQLRAQADLVTRDLQLLHGIEVDEGSLDELIARHCQSREAAELERSTSTQAFEAEMKAARAAWRCEQQEHAAAAAEAARSLEQARQRDVQEYEYEQQAQHARLGDERAQRHKQLEQELAELREGKAAQWAEREQRLAAREQERVELQARADAFAAERDAAIKRAEQEGMAIARRQTKVQADLAHKGYEGVRRVFELKIEALESTIAKQDTQIEELARQLEDARKQTTELAVKAIDGASNASSFVAIKEIALEQAKNTHKNK